MNTLLTNYETAKTLLLEGLLTERMRILGDKLPTVEFRADNVSGYKLEALCTYIKQSIRCYSPNSTSNHYFIRMDVEYTDTWVFCHPDHLKIKIYLEEVDIHTDLYNILTIVKSFISYTDFSKLVEE